MFHEYKQQRGQFHSEFCMRVCAWNTKSSDIFKPYIHSFLPSFNKQINIHAIQKMAENTILVFNISCILEHQQDKSFTEPISWGENMFGEKHSIHLQDQHSDPYHKYYRKKLSLIFNSLFFFFSFLKIFNLSHLNISIIIIIFP